MKALRYLLLLIIVTGSLSCKKFLDTQPTDTLSPDYYYATEAQMNNSLTGVYDIMGSENVYGNSIFTRLTAATDESYYQRSTQATGTQVLNFDSSDPDIRLLWQSLYQGIERANLVLANIKKPAMDETKRGVIEGEALFLRAYYHFLLVSNWGDVPMILKPTASIVSTDVARTPAREVYDQILSDMTKAEGLVKSIAEIGFGGRVSKSAVQGILARVNLYMAGYPLKDVSRYAEALSWAKKVVSGPAGHALNNDYKQIFINYAQDKYDTKESIWEVEFWGNRLGNAYTEAGRVGNNNGILCTNEKEGYGYGFIGATPGLFKLYENGDLRRDWAIAPFRYNGATTTRINWTAAEIYQRNSGKFRREYELLEKQKNYTPQNFPLLRYADVLLMLAEASNEVNGPGTEGIDAVNLLRKRAFGKNLSGEQVRTISVTAGGAGYLATNPPVITITGGGASRNATATVTIVGGKITAVNITDFGAFYTSIPTVTISGGAGTGALAKATISVVGDESLTPAQTASKEAFRTVIKEEREKELCFEALRRADLIRWEDYVGKLQKTAAEATAGAPANFKYIAIGGNNVDVRHLLFPIPLYETSVNKLLLPNNKGW
ncbi:Starch-binding associating with outer membrane [Pedobacter steynii]|uniref:Starch-binding associating with outer membrane n=1 Tax=Pedobacter steynii TaxID=430522 RepID=A0A1G9SCQ6_9SPHI|nr:RagB/SusD family nutrient uptake outer membrane protein [Pedobacter steynii]NQX37485.1 RagB/SusD family nutrient uptake outer membrane protein [Pedobacter steynii]SDM32585.1 Starch-binding associating with outer membrane [Pedobacter steynii]